jgi:hypothetical protein
LRQYPQPEAEFFVHASHHSAPHFIIFLFDLIPVFSLNEKGPSLYILLISKSPFSVIGSSSFSSNRRIMHV